MSLHKSRKRHFAKTITWRIVGTADTMLLTWLISGDPLIGFKVGSIEVFTKMILYYFHERIWFRRNFETKKRHLLKTITWRILGSIDTVVIGWLVSGDLSIGAAIGGAEVLTKMILYFLHEKLWYRFDYGIKEKRYNE